MKKVTVRQLAVATALLFTLGVALASAEGGFRHGHRGMRGGFGIMKGLSRLDLTDSQKTEVKRIMESRKATFESLHERTRADGESLRAIADVSTPDPTAVGAAYLKVRAGRQALRAERESTMQDIRSILTTEQKEKLDSMVQERKEGFRGHRGMRGSPVS